MIFSTITSRKKNIDHLKMIKNKYKLMLLSSIYRQKIKITKNLNTKIHWTIYKICTEMEWR